MVSASLGGLEFNGDGGTATYTIEALSGWFDGVDSRRESIPRPAAHGDFDVPTYLGGRLVTITGLVLASTDAGFESAVDALSGLLADGSSSELSVEQSSKTLTAMVRRAGSPDIQVQVYGESARFRVEFWAADPRRYGATHTFGPDTSVTGISHDGNFPATPVLTVSGSSGGGYTITRGPYLITVTEPLVSGDPHTIDLATGALYVDGVRTLGGISVYEPWTVPAVGSVSASVSAGTLQVDVTDTWS